MPVSLRDLGIDPTEEDLTALSLDATMQDTVKLSRIRPLDATDVKRIYHNAI
jgi:alcohol dehydrogenase YqhD (iron-dependent ADH family)